MPNKQAAVKYIRKTKTRTVRNNRVKNRLKRLIKATRDFVNQGNTAEAKKTLTKTIKALDKASQHGYVKKNTASRKKSRLTLAVNKMKPAKKVDTKPQKTTQTKSPAKTK